MKKVQLDRGSLNLGIPFTIYGVAEMVEDPNDYRYGYDPGVYPDTPKFWYLRKEDAEEKQAQLVKDRSWSGHPGYMIVPGEGISLLDGTVRVLGLEFVQMSDKNERVQEAREKLKRSGLTVSELADLVEWAQKEIT